MELYRPGIDVRLEAIVANSRLWNRVAMSQPPCAAAQGLYQIARRETFSTATRRQGSTF